MQVNESETIVKDIRITVPKVVIMTASVNGTVNFEMSGVSMRTDNTKDLVKVLRQVQDACQAMISKVEN